jgi:hypothetical protein
VGRAQFDAIGAGSVEGFALANQVAGVAAEGEFVEQLV